MLEEEFEIGLIILAGVHAGTIPFNCTSCDDKDCDSIGDEPIAIFDDIGEFYSCPLRWITPAIYEWYDEWSYYQVFPSAAPPYNKVTSRFWEACKVYKREYDKQVDIKQRSKADTSDKALSSLRQGFRKRK